MRLIYLPAVIAWITDRLAVITNRTVTISVDCTQCVEQVYEVTGPRRQAGVAADVIGQIHMEEEHSEEEA